MYIFAFSVETVRQELQISLDKWDQFEPEVKHALSTVVTQILEIRIKLDSYELALSLFSDRRLQGLIQEFQQNIKEVLVALKLKIDSNELPLVLSDAKLDFHNSLNRLNNLDFVSINFFKKYLEEKTRVASDLESWLPLYLTKLESMDKARLVTLVTTWISEIQQCRNELDAFLVKVQDLETPKPKEKLIKASKLANPLLRAHIEVLADKLEEITNLKDEDKFVGPIQKLDTNSCKFILDQLAKEHALLRFFLEEQDLKKPLLYGALLKNTNYLESFQSYLRTAKRGKYTYNLYEINGQPVLVYDGWLIARTKGPLLQIKTGDILRTKKASRINFSFNKQAKLTQADITKVATLLRCTFTSNARLDTPFMDFMRSLNAQKIGPNTWDIPVSNSSDISNLKAKLKLDWGFPFIYETLEQASAFHKLYDVSTGGGTKFSSVVRFASVPAFKDLLVIQDNDRFHLRSKNNHLWNGGSGSKKAICKKLASLKLEATKPDIDQLRNVQSRLKNLTSNDEQVNLKIANLASKLQVVANWIVADTQTHLVDQTTLLEPAENSSLVIANRVYFVQAKTSTNPLAWLDLEDDRSRKMVLLKPDLFNKSALMTQEKLATLGDTSIDQIIAVDVPEADQVAIPTKLMVTLDGEEYLVDFDENNEDRFLSDSEDILEEVKVLGVQDKQGNSPMGGYPCNNFLSMPASMPVTNIDPEHRTLYYPNPPGKLLVPIDFTQESYPFNEQTYTKNLIDKDRSNVSLYNDGAGLGEQQHVTFGPHPGLSLKSTDRAISPSQVNIYNPWDAMDSSNDYK